MNTPFAKAFFGFGLFLALTLMTGFSATNQASPTPTASPTATATVTVLPSPTPYLATSTPEMTPTPTVPPTQPNLIAAADQASFVRENYPDNSVLKPGEKFVKTFEIKNSGSIPWTASYSFVLDSAHQNETLGSPSQINLPQETPPGGIVSLSIPLTAPTTPGTYTVYWTLKNKSRETILSAYLIAPDGTHRCASSSCRQRFSYVSNAIVLLIGNLRTFFGVFWFITVESYHLQ